MSNKVLFVAYHFPPDAEVGTLRSQKFVKYLQEHGWQPFVLTNLQELRKDGHYTIQIHDTLIWSMLIFHK